MEFQNFVDLVESMRKCQKEALVKRQLPLIQQAKILEKEVDTAIRQLKREVESSTAQQDLF